MCVLPQASSKGAIAKAKLESYTATNSLGFHKRLYIVDLTSYHSLNTCWQMHFRNYIKKNSEEYISFIKGHLLKVHISCATLFFINIIDELVHSIIIKLNPLKIVGAVSIVSKKCLFAHSVCANFGLNALTLYVNFSLDAH